LNGAPWGAVIYATHRWEKIEEFVKKQPILIKRSEL